MLITSFNITPKFILNLLCYVEKTQSTPIDFYFLSKITRLFVNIRYCLDDIFNLLCTKFLKCLDFHEEQKRKKKLKINRRRKLEKVMSLFCTLKTKKWRVNKISINLDVQLE